MNRNEVYARTSNVRHHYQNGMLWDGNRIPGPLMEDIRDFVDGCIPGNLRVLGLTKIQIAVPLYVTLTEIMRSLK
jgi:hypothetical protein